MDERAMDQVNDLLTGFSAAHGMSRATLGEEGTCAFDHISGLSVILELSSDGGTLHWLTRLLEVPAEGREVFFANLLELNLPGSVANGSVLALDQPNNAVLALYGTPLASLDVLSFSNVMENFLTTVLDLRDGLNQASESSYAPAPVDENDTMAAWNAWQFRV